MCGIFGEISRTGTINRKNLETLVKHSEQRGMDSSGLAFIDDDGYKIRKADYKIEKLLKRVKPYNSQFVMGHSRLITNGLRDNQPVCRDNMALIHNGIIVNEEEIWKSVDVQRQFQIDSEAILALAIDYLKKYDTTNGLPNYILQRCEGTVACALLLPQFGELVLFSNNGSLYYGESGEETYFASERYVLDLIGCDVIEQIKTEAKFVDIPRVERDFEIVEYRSRTENLIPGLFYHKEKAKLLHYKPHNLRRCTKCILPETMPFIEFDGEGVCNYCRHYTPRNQPKPKEELFRLVEPYRRPGSELDCIVPFSGGRDSCYSLHLIVNELGMKPVTYTYDWGMVTDLARRNISRMCGKLGVENIIVAADISKKRRNIRKNLTAWLEAPHLGLIALLTAGDKHFFRYVEHIKRQTGIDLNLWGVNPLEATHFKAGFLGVPPNFEEEKVYYNGLRKQVDYHMKRFKAMLGSPKYFNTSLWDTLSGEYYRSFMQKKDYYHIFDYYRWDEKEINNTLIKKYDWETAIDTPSTWRIGDGTAGFYNYVYYTVAGFTEHDTFRSNQIREGDLNREEALRLIEEENRPRYQNIKWYLDVLGMDFEEVIRVVNAIPKLHPDLK
jgi:hypothetical protein